MESRPQHLRWPVGLMVLFAFCLLGVAIYDAVGFHGAPIAGIWVEPDAIVSNAGLAGWSGRRQGLTFPDRVVQVDGEELAHPAPGEYRAQAFDRAVSKAAIEGRPSVHVRVESRDKIREVDLTIEPLSSLAWWTYGGILFFSGALYVVAAAIALSVARSPLTRTFAKVALLSSVLCFSFFDLHTARHLVPFARFAFAMSPMAMIGLGLRLPDDARVVTKHPWVLWALDGVGMVLGLTFAFAERREVGTGLAVTCTVLYAFGLFALAGMVTWRFLRSRGKARDLMRPLVLTLAFPYALVSSAFLLHGPVKAVADVAALPLLTLTPLATMVAFARHDIWKSRALLSRFATRAVIAAVACAAAIGVGAAVAVSMATTLSQALLGAAAGALAATLFVGPALRYGDRLLFPSMAEYKPTVEQLSEELASISSPQDVVRAVERIVRRWLPCQAVEFEIDDLSRDGPVKALSNELVLPVLFRGTRIGTLRVTRADGGPLFTSEDRDLLKTIANQGALAMAHSIAYAELETRRKQQAAAFREEREALVETLSAEIAHEVRYPINFFRSIFQRASKSRALDEEEVEIGCEEVERLERLVSGLRRMAVQHVERRVVQLGELTAHAEMLLRDRIGRRKLSVDLGGGGAVRCDVDKVTQVLVNLLANALDATDGRGEVGITWVCTGKGGELSVWDTGPGYGGDSSRLFAPWYTTKSRGSGLGLAITSRLVRLHGWTIEPYRIAGRTAFVVSIPLADVLSAEELPLREGIVLDSETVRVTSARKGEVA